MESGVRLSVWGSFWKPNTIGIEIAITIARNARYRNRSSSPSRSFPRERRGVCRTRQSSGAYRYRHIPRRTRFSHIPLRIPRGARAFAYAYTHTHTCTCTHRRILSGPIAQSPVSRRKRDSRGRPRGEPNPACSSGTFYITATGAFPRGGLPRRRTSGADGRR